MRFPAFLFVTIALSAAISQLRADTLLVLNKDGTVAIDDPVTQKVLGRATTGEGPHEIVSAGNGLAVVSNYGGGRTLSVIDLKSRKEIHRVDVSPLSRPHGLAAFGNKVYFTAEGSRNIGRYDPASNRVDWTFPTGQDGTHMVVLSKDGAKIFTSNIGSGSISVFERSGSEQPGEDWHGTTVKVGDGPEGFDLSPDGKQIWAANSGDGTVSIIDVASKQVVATINAGTKRSNRLKFTPDSKRVLISDFSTGDLIVVETAARKVVKRLKIASSIAGILVSPDGAHAYVAATYDNFVAVLDLRSLEVSGRIMTGNGPDGMDWIQGN
jgi:YVTN family beta-propeller protein